MDNVTVPEVLGVTEAAYDQARLAFARGSWANAIRSASEVLGQDPYHAPAFDLLVAAKRNLELSGAPVGELRFLSVLMCDLVGSSRLTRTLGTEDYRDLLLEVLKACAMAVTAYEGRIAQYRGDGILAYFSYPQAHEDDALRAVLAALEIVAGVVAIAPSMEERFGIEPRVRVGVDTGTVLVGALGAGQWMSADALVGDAPNRASRIQGFARPNAVVISDSTYALVEGLVEVRTGRPRAARSFDEPIRVHRVLRPTGAAGRLQALSRRTPLIGRESELAMLNDAWASVLAGEKTVVQLVGEAGIGKSRLAEQLINLAHASGGRHITLHCSSLYRQVAFHPLSEAIRGLLGLHLSQSPPTLDLVADRLQAVAGDDELVTAVAPVVAQLLGLPGEVDDLPEQRRERSLATLTRLVNDIAQASPLLVVVDDVVDADPSTLELLLRLLEQVPHPFALVATSRSEATFLGPTTRIIPVGPLDGSETERLVRSIIFADDEKVAGVVARAGGNPFFAEELARLVAEVGSDRRMPDSLEALLAARLDVLAPAVRELVSTAAVLGERFEHGELVEVSDSPPASVEEALGVLVDRQLLTVNTETLGHEYRFSHVLYQEAAYDRQLGGVRIHRHLRCAEVLERRARAGFPVAAAVIARHYQEAGRRLEALPWWELAAARSSETAAHPEAIAHYHHAIQLVDALDEESDRDAHELALRLGLGASSTMVLGYSSREALEAFERADALARSAPTTPELIGALMGLQAFAFVTGQMARADELAARAVEAAQLAGDDALAATAYAALGYVRFFRGDLGGARALLERTDHAISLPGIPQEPRVASLVLLGIVDWLQGDLDASADRLGNALAAADLLEGDRAAFTRAFVLAYLAGHAQLADDADRAAAYAEQTLELANEHRFLIWLGAGGLHLGAAWCAQGQLELGLTTILAGIESWRAAGAELMMPYFLARGALARVALGEADAGRTLIDEALEAAERTGEHLYDPELHRIRAGALLAANRPVAEVEDELECAAMLARNGGYPIYELRALLDLIDVDSRSSHRLALKRIGEIVAMWSGRRCPPEAERASLVVAEPAIGVTS
jgi:class 3 adenylate cyclase